MGKAKKIKVSAKQRNVALEKQIESDAKVKPIREKRGNDGRDEEQFVDSKLSKTILREARKQIEDLQEQFEQKAPRASLDINACGNALDEESEASGDEIANDHNQYYEDIEINEEDAKALEIFMSKETTKRKTLADYIAEKLKERETEIKTQFSDAASVKFQDLDEKVVELYKGVKTVLSRYRSGKLPKAFKIIPALSNWEQILSITDPDSWSAAAMFQATRLFTSNLKENMAQRFFNLILLPRIRDDIAEFKRLNFHLYQALRKALFKPGAFFKGIVLPLCESGDCTLREAVIVGSVLSKNHIPVLHASAAILKIAEMEYNGANSVLLNVLINKKYALPYRVIDALVHHFLRFMYEKRELPVLWHQCLLVFVQHYKEDLSSEQKESLFDLLKAQSHYQITPIIRDLLLNSKCRDVEEEMMEEPLTEKVDS
ncbi:bystin-like protein [Dinothrombium tinctorium]|uniref:Bystin n=1 Tax=Dinothrombium tinctorium TaxID=1965070 RepID=A0A3S3PLU7_9ACAR|nr:bystin-like protein [Dinothrombium tinctorium]